MKELVAIDGWTSSTQEEYKGKYQDENGNGLCGTWRREYKNSYEVVILSNGNSLRRYKYPKGIIPFESKMLRWQNVYHEEYNTKGMDDIKKARDIVDAVIAGIKPIGCTLSTRQEIKTFEQKARATGLSYTYFGKTNESYDGIDNYRFAIANRGKLGQVFDLESYAKSFREFGQTWNIEGYLRFIESESLLELSELIELNSDGNRYQYSYLYDELSVGDMMLADLIRGFPIEFTIAHLMK